MQEELGLTDDQVLHTLNIIDGDQPGQENAIKDFIAQGVTIVIATSWGYMDVCEKYAAIYPHVVFAHATGYKRNETNFTNYFGRIYQARYLSGIAAGMKTQSNKIGYVAAMGKDSSEVTGGINAFAIGVEKVNPRAKIFVRVTGSWFDPMTETSAARSLLASGCDVIAQHCDTEYPQAEAQKAGVWGIGYNSDMSLNAPDAVITSVVWHWDVYYKNLVKSVIDGSFTTEPWFNGIDDGMVGITPLAPFAAEGTDDFIKKEFGRIVTGEFNVFDGELETNEGTIIGRPGGTLSDEEITGKMNWYYRNVAEDR